jgi:type I restriction enzyme, S subunit
VKRRKAWATKALAEVSAIKYGYTDSATSEAVGPRFLRITDIQDDRVDWERVPYCKIEVADRPKYRLATGDIVFARTGATTGKSFLVDNPPDAVFASYLIRLRLLDTSLSPKFVSFFFQTPDYWKSIQEGSSGSAQGGFNATKLGALSIPVPPLPEQERIVAILDQAFEGIATAKANAERNLQNSFAIFESQIRSVFADNAEVWDRRELIDLCAFFFDSAHRTPKYQEEGIPALRPRDVVNGQLNLSDTMRVSKAEYEIQTKRHKPHSGDIVYSRELSYGWAAVLPQSPRVCLSQGMCIFRPSPNIDTSFLLFVLNSYVGRQQANRAAVGSAHPHINLSEIKAFKIPTPPVETQRRVASQFDGLVAETRRLANIYERKLAALSALKRSLLHRAFAGELTGSTTSELIEVEA